MKAIATKDGGIYVEESEQDLKQKEIDRAREAEKKKNEDAIESKKFLNMASLKSKLSLTDDELALILNP
jgi:hypothetical protein